MRDRWKISLLVIFALGAGVLPALAAEDCRLTRVADLKLAPDWSVPVVPVTLQGRQKFLIVSTGGFWSTLGLATARELDLKMGVSNTVALIGPNGKSRSSTAWANFQIGVMPEPILMQFMIDPTDDGKVSDVEPIGSLGPEKLMIFDVELNFAAGQINLFVPAPCPGQVVYWQTQPVAVVPFRINPSRHILFPVTIDGKKLNAMLSTGTSNTVMNLSVARRAFDITPESPGLEKTGELKGAYTAAIYQRRFGTLQIEGVTVNNPMITLMPDMMEEPTSRVPRVGSLIANRDDIVALQDVILGMSVLSKLHIYIAYKEKKLYITAASPQAQ